MTPNITKKIEEEIMKTIRFLWFIISDVFWGGIKFYLEIPFYVWRKFQEKEKEFREKL